jgi:hypothetical protein
MSDTAFQTMYRQEMIAGFEKRQSLLRRSTVTEAVVNGNSAVFLVGDSGGATAVTRGIDGDIPTRPDNLNQNTATLQEWHDVPERTRFNLFASQGNGRKLMQTTCMSVINRKIDEDIRTALSAASVTWGSAAAATLTLVTIAKTKLGNAFADLDAPIFAAITPAFHGYLMGLNQFTSADYVKLPGFDGIPKDKAFSWYGVNWIIDPQIDGVGSASATCYMYSQNAIGHACDTENLQTAVGYDSQNDKSWARCSTFMGSKLLQNSGVVKMLHNDSALS